MLLGIVFRRIVREWRLMGVLLFALSMVSAFLALAPMYVRTIATAEFESRIEAIDLTSVGRDRFRIDINNDEPLTDDFSNIIDDTVRDMVTEVKHYHLSNDRYPNAQLFPRVVAYREFDRLFELADGDYPQTSSEEGVVEAVITRQSWEQIRNLHPNLIDFDIGSSLLIGPFRAGVRVRVVGIVNATIPEGDPYWNYSEFTFGNRRSANPEDQLDFALIVPETLYISDYVDIVNDSGGTTYFAELILNPDEFTADRLNGIGSNVEQLTTTLRNIHPDIMVSFGLDDLISDFKANIKETEAPVILLSLLVLILMLYNLVATVTLILNQQRREWAVISSRGGSASQLVIIHGITMLLIGSVASGLGILLALGIMTILTFVGPQADILDPSHITQLPTSTITLSLIASLASVILLTVIALPLARSNLIGIRSSTSRPPTRPLWARYFLDVLFIALGIIFIARLYSIILGDIGQSLDDLLQTPSLLIDTLTSTSLNTEALRDPFNLAGPVLLIIGFTLLWIRLFPLLMRFIQIVLSRVNQLPLKLALWTVERDPSHYSQLVLLLIGTLALGIASLALSETQRTSAWNQAHHDIGGNASLSIDPRLYDDERDWASLPSVTQATSLMISEWDDVIPSETISLIGVNPTEIVALMPEYEAMLTALETAETPAYSGFAVPDDTQTITLDVYPLEDSENPDALTETNITLELLNTTGVRVLVPMQTADNTITHEFIQYSATLSAEHGQAPWRVVGIRFSPLSGTAITIDHIVYLDNLVAHDSNEQETVIYDFETATFSDLLWESNASAFSSMYTPVNNTEQVTQGEASLRVRYRIVRTNRPFTTLSFNQQSTARIPVLISPAFATRFGMRSGQRRPLEIGDELATEIELPISSNAPIRAVRVVYQVAGIIENFPGLSPESHYLISRLDLLRWQLNQSATATDYFDINRVWLNTSIREPNSELTTALQELPEINEVNYAWEQFNFLQRDPLSNAITGMLFAGFWISLGLILLDFAFYMSVTIRQRTTSFAVLRAMGWERKKIWGQLLFEQIAFITPALIVGFGFGMLLGYLILPFLGIEGISYLQLPLVDFGVLTLILIGGFAVILMIFGILLGRLAINQMIRVAE